MFEINNSLNGGCHGNCKEKNNCQKENRYKENCCKEKNEIVNLRPFAIKIGERDHLKPIKMILGSPILLARSKIPLFLQSAEQSVFKFNEFRFVVQSKSALLFGPKLNTLSQRKFVGPVDG
jgi:hypothetical protein